MGRNRYSPREQQFYRNYLNSPAWRIRKAARVLAAGRRCEFVTTHHAPGGAVEVRCPRTRYLCVHHNTYERLGAERATDLDVFCWAHHMIEHLLWKACVFCGQPCLGYDSLAELWLAATLSQAGIDLDGGPVNWRRLPTKEQLAAQISSKCMPCRGVDFTPEET